MKNKTWKELKRNKTIKVRTHSRVLISPLSKRREQKKIKN